MKQTLSNIIFTIGACLIIAAVLPLCGYRILHESDPVFKPVEPTYIEVCTPEAAIDWWTGDEDKLAARARMCKGYTKYLKPKEKK